MDTLTIIGIVLIAWGVMTLSVALFRPAFIWKLGKIQGFVQLLGETGTTILFSVLAGAAIIGGVLIIL